MGFSATVNAIIANLPKSRQTLLFSATQTKSVKDLARLSLHDPEYVAVREGVVSSEGKGKGKSEEDDEGGASQATPKNLEQHYMVVELDKKMDVLWSFIKTHLFTKTIVFLSSGKQVSRLLFPPSIPWLSLSNAQKLDRYDSYTKISVIFDPVCRYFTCTVNKSKLSD